MYQIPLSYEECIANTGEAILENLVFLESEPKYEDYDSISTPFYNQCIQQQKITSPFNFFKPLNLQEFHMRSSFYDKVSEENWETTKQFLKNDLKGWGQTSINGFETILEHTVVTTDYHFVILPAYEDSEENNIRLRNRYINPWRHEGYRSLYQRRRKYNLPKSKIESLILAIRTGAMIDSSIDFNDTFSNIREKTYDLNELLASLADEDLEMVKEYVRGNLSMLFD